MSVNRTITLRLVLKHLIENFVTVSNENKANLYFAQIILFVSEIGSNKMAQHLEDHAYIFSSILKKPVRPDSSRDAQMVERHTRLLAAFARDGYLLQNSISNDQIF